MVPNGRLRSRAAWVVLVQVYGDRLQIIDSSIDNELRAIGVSQGVYSHLETQSSPLWVGC